MEPGLIPARAGNTRLRCRSCRRGWAHPRSRGEHCGLLGLLFVGLGSSPLARGTPQAQAARHLCRGLIPARAGNTCRCGRARRWSWAHPRSRGEHMASATATSKTGGSSPLARGTRFQPRIQTARPGLIPARAGNTGVGVGSGAGSGAHPRSRGEHKYWGAHALTIPGSSPLARGTRLLYSRHEPSSGLIPARAGNTSGARGYRRGWWAHPRSRGEHVRVHPVSSTAWGSSPLARGTHVAVAQSVRAVGLIPARAGNTQYRAEPPAPGWAHPRSRGEHAPSPLRNTTALGSSPLARGTPLPRNLGTLIRGLIPARAGNTCRCPFHKARQWAHPRSRGEHFCVRLSHAPGGGSSPLARGTRSF